MKFELNLDFAQTTTLIERDSDGELCFLRGQWPCRGDVWALANLENDCIELDIILEYRAAPHEGGQRMNIQLSEKEARSLGKALILMADAMGDA